MTKTPNKTELKKSYQSLRSVKAVADHYDVSESIVTGWMNDKGIERQRFPKFNFTKTELKKLYKNSSLREVASKVGCNKETIRQHLIRHGLDRN